MTIIESNIQQIMGERYIKASSSLNGNYCHFSDEVSACGEVQRQNV